MKEKQIKITDWLTKGMSKEQIQKKKEEAIREAEIELIAKTMCGGCSDDKECLQGLCKDWYNAERLYNAGYRIPKEGTWKLYKDGSAVCSSCGFTSLDAWDYDNWQNYCGHCGAKMIGIK